MNKVATVLTRSLEMVLALLLFAIAAIIISLVGLQFLFSTTITGANELVTMLFVYTTAIGAAVAVGKREHIDIPFAMEFMPLPIQKVIDFLSVVLVALVNAVLVVYSLGWIRITGDYLMPATGLPRIVAQVSVPMGCSLAIFYCVFLLFVPFAERKDFFPTQKSSTVSSRSAR